MRLAIGPPMPATDRRSVTEAGCARRSAEAVGHVSARLMARGLLPMAGHHRPIEGRGFGCANLACSFRWRSPVAAVGCYPAEEDWVAAADC